MLVAKELRIGNCYLVDATALTTEGFSVFSDFNDYGHFLYDCSPIPLTPEILKKAAAFNNERCVLKVNINKIGLVTFDIGGITFSTVHYLHQLQNLYFSLTSEELEINL